MILTSPLEKLRDTDQSQCLRLHDQQRLGQKNNPNPLGPTAPAPNHSAMIFPIQAEARDGAIAQQPKLLPAMPGSQMGTGLRPACPTSDHTSCQWLMVWKSH